MNSARNVGLARPGPQSLRVFGFAEKSVSNQNNMSVRYTA